MASGPYDQVASAEAPRERSLGEHIFIWIAWALAAAFWGATMTTFFGILHAAGQTVQQPDAPGAPGGMGYLGLVIAAFLIMGLALLYAELRSTRSPRLGAAADAGAAALYDSAERDERA